MDAKQRRFTLVLLFLSILVAFSGQYYFANKRDFMWDGLFLYLVAMLLFGWAISRIEGVSTRGTVNLQFWEGFWQALRGSVVRLGVLLAGLGLGAYVAIASGGRSQTKPFWDLLVLWGGSIALVIAAFVDWTTLPQRMRRLAARMLSPTPEAALVFALVIITFLLRGTHLASIPYILSGDEASMGLEAVSVIDGRRNDPFVTGWLSHPTLFFFFQAAFLRLFGISTWALRLPSALISSVTVVFLYLFARRFFGRWVAILSAIFFCGYHYAIHFGRLAINNIWDPFFALGALYFLDRGLTRKRLGPMLAGGFLLGLAVYFYMGAKLIPIILLVYLAYLAISDPDLVKGQFVPLLIAALVSVVVALPLLAFYRAHPADMMARWKWVGIFPSGWVTAEMARTGKTALGVFSGQFLKAVLAFHFFPDPTFWYRPGIPLLRFLPSVFFVFGFTYAVRQWGKRGYFLLVVWFLLVIIFGGALLENPPTSPRLVLAIPPVVMCVVLGVVKVAQYVEQMIGKPRRLAVALSLVLILFASYQSAHFYLVKYTPSHEFAGLNTEVADGMGKYLRVLGPSYKCYFFGAPRMYYNFATIPFIAQGVEGIDVTAPIRDNVDFVQSHGRATFVFLPERRSEFDVVQRFYPSGRLREFRNQKGQILFIAYEVDG